MNKNSLPLAVTGAAGFIGSAFVEECNRRNIPILSVDDESYFKNRPELEGLNFGKIVDRKNFISFLNKSGVNPSTPAVSGIIHLGACTDTMEFDETYLAEMNTKYSQEIWKYCASSKTPLVYASSAATYGDGALGYDDDESKISLLKPLNPYGQSKQDFDLWVLDQEKKGISPPSWSGHKFFNVYGMREEHKEKMASVVLHGFKQISKTKKMNLFKSHRAGIADGHQARDFIFVKDLVDVLFYSLEKPISRGIFNLGSGTARTFLDLAKATFSGLELKPEIEFIDTPLNIRDKYQYFTQANMTKLRSAGYSKPFTSLEAGVHQYVQWLKRQS
jgi:ADP-L-glycero-D-manno-heptose 6-epimerase